MESKQKTIFTYHNGMFRVSVGAITVKEAFGQGTRVADCCRTSVAGYINLVPKP